MSVSMTDRRQPQMMAEVWHAVERATFAILSHVTPQGAPRSSGVLFTTIERQLYVVVARDSWKARHITATSCVAVTVPVRRGGVLSLVLPIPPATISFAGTANVLPADSPAARPVLNTLGRMLPPNRYESASIIEIRPEGHFLTYGIGVPLMRMRDPEQSRARVPVS